MGTVDIDIRRIHRSTTLVMVVSHPTMAADTTDSHTVVGIQIPITETGTTIATNKNATRRKNASSTAQSK